MKELVIFFDCHGYEILKYFDMNNEFKRTYNITKIGLNDYVVRNKKYFNNSNLEIYHQNIIKKADVLILQVIEKNRGYLNNNKIENLCKKDCLIIKIPHYRNSIYEYKTLEGYITKKELIKKWSLPNKIKDIFNVDETIQIIKKEIDKMNNYKYDKNKMLEQFNIKYNEFNKIDKLSDIKMIDFYQNNYKKNRLFKSRSYPSSIFFYELSNRILSKLNIKPNRTFVDLYFAENTSEPIPTYWYNFCDFKFKNIYHTYGHFEIKEYEWYYILLLSNNINITNKDENNEYIKKIRKL